MRVLGIATIAVGLAGSAMAASPPARPANPRNLDGFRVGQSQPTPELARTEVRLWARLTSPAADEVDMQADVRLYPRRGGAIECAVVQLEWTLPNGEKHVRTGTTDCRGSVSFSIRNRPGEYTARVLGIGTASYVKEYRLGEVQAVAKGRVGIRFR